MKSNIIKKIIKGTIFSIFFVTSLFLNLGIASAYTFDYGAPSYGDYSYDYGSPSYSNYSYDYGSPSYGNYSYDYGTPSYDYGNYSYSYDYGTPSYDYGSYSYDYGTPSYDYGNYSYSYDYGTPSYDYANGTSQTVYNDQYMDLYDTIYQPYGTGSTAGGCGSSGCGSSGYPMGGSSGCSGYFGCDNGSVLHRGGNSVGLSNNSNRSNSSNRSSNVEKSETNSTHKSVYTYTDNSDNSVTDNSIRTYSDDDINIHTEDSHDRFEYNLEVDDDEDRVGTYASSLGSYYVPTAPQGQNASLSSVYLSQVPYTGAKEVMTIIGYIAAVIVWSAIVVYFLAKRKGKKTTLNRISAFKENNRLATEIA